MKKIECIIPPKKFLQLEDFLRREGIYGMTVSDVKGYGNQQTRPETYLFLPKTKVELYCRDEDMERIIDVIVSVCKTGNLGDGKIAVLDVKDLIRVRTEERGEAAV